MKLCLGRQFLVVLLVLGCSRTGWGADKPHFYRQVHVLCIGIDDYWSTGVAPLKSAESDAQALANCLHEHFGFTATPLLGREATKAAITHKLDELDETLGDHDALLVYFAGHGHVFRYTERDGALAVQRRAGFLIPYEADLDLAATPRAERWQTEAIDMQWLIERVEAMQAHHVVLLADACCSGFLTKRGGIESPEVIKLLKDSSRCVVAATTQKEQASEGKFNPRVDRPFGAVQQQRGSGECHRRVSATPAASGAGLRRNHDAADVARWSGGRGVPVLPVVGPGRVGRPIE